MLKQVKFRHVILLALLIVLALVSLLMVIKPGAAIFYHKSTVQMELLKPDEGHAYRYSLSANLLLEPTGEILLFEDGQPLNSTTTKEVVNIGRGAFNLSDLVGGKYFLYFSPSDNSDPRTNGKDYTIYQPVVFLSRAMGIRYLMLFVLCVVVWIAFKKFGYPAWLLTTKAPYLKSTFTLTILAAYLFVFMEWLFFVTKPSFMDIMSFPEKIGIFFLTGFIFSLLSVGLLIILTGLDYLLVYLKMPRITSILLIAVPAGIFTAMIFLLIDNFTYTLFKFGVFSTEGIWRGVYGVVVILLFIYIYNSLLVFLGLKRDSEAKWQPSKIQLIFVGGLLVVSAAIAVIRFSSTADIDSVQGASGDVQRTIKRPHILLIGSDGLLAQNMSVYGYERDTTPRIRELSRASLLAENAYSNAASSAGSVVSILTGKLATDSRVFYPPDILKGSDSFQHLPGILKREGYRTEEIGVRHYVDSSTLNLQNAFDVVNGRTIDSGSTIYFIREFGFYDTAYMLSALTERIENRLYHVFYLRTMENPYAIVTKPDEEQVNRDRARVDRLLELLIEADEPLFVHMHLMGTHGSLFYPEHQVFSEGQEQDEYWMTDFYDDAILTYDSYVGEIIDTLEKAGLLDDTLIILYTDHGQKYYINDRIPLIFHFPDNEFQGRIATNVQNLDIAPTIIDYLGLPQQEWMSGESLLNDNLDANRLIFSIGMTYAVKELDNELWILDENRATPPFYQFSNFYVINCQRWYQLNLDDFEADESWGDVVGHTSPCSEDSLLTRDQIEDAVIEHLSRAGFDVSSLP